MVCFSLLIHYIEQRFQRSMNFDIRNPLRLRRLTNGREQTRRAWRQRNPLASPSLLLRRTFWVTLWACLLAAAHSSLTVTMIVRWRPRTSHSRWKICCPDIALPRGYERLPRKYCLRYSSPHRRNISMKVLTLSKPTAIETSVTDFLCASISRAANNRACCRQRPNDILDIGRLGIGPEGIIRFERMVLSMFCMSLEACTFRLINSVIGFGLAM